MSLFESPLLDTSALDTNLRQISSIEKAWSLPAMPDMVKLDLASQAGADTQALAGFLYGLESDITATEDEDAQSPFDTTTGQLVRPLSPAEQVLARVPSPTAGEWGRIVWNDTLGLRPAQKLDRNAVQVFKAQAVEGGYLSPDQVDVNSPLWSPELNAVRRQMLIDQGRERIQGEGKVGATSWQRVGEFVGDWLSPTGLLKAAVELDFFWDFDQIGREASNWGDKWRKFANTKSPVDLIDALTGPVDDIIIPILNIGLLATGVGQVWSFGRAAYTAGRVGYSGSKLVQGLYTSNRVGRAASSFLRAGDIAADVDRMRDASWLATRALNSEWNYARKAGEAMQAWRQFRPVAVTKKVTQQGMRLGVASRLQDSLPGYEGIGAEDVAPGVVEDVQGALSSPYAWAVFEPLFTPYSVFQQGAFTKAARGAGRMLADTGAALVWPIGAIGDAAAAKNIWGLRRAQALSFKKATEDERLVGTFYTAYRDTIDDPDRLARFERTFNASGARAALMEDTGMAEEDLGLMMTWVATAAALDREASAAATLLAGADRNGKWWELYYANRNKLLQQMRMVDTSSDSFAQDVMYKRAVAAGGNRQQVLRRYRQLRARFEDPNDLEVTEDTLLEAASEWNEGATEALKNVMAGLDEETLTAYLPQVLGNLKDWGTFQSAMHDVEQLVGSGILDDIEVVTARGPGGGVLNAIPELKPMTGKSFYRDVNQARSEYWLPEASFEQFRSQFMATRGYRSPLQRILDPDMGKVVVMRADTPSKQALLEKARRAKSLDETIDLVDAVSRRGEELGVLVAVEQKLGGSLSSVSRAVLKQEILDAAAAAGVSKTDRIARLARIMSREGLSTTDLRQQVNALVDEFNADDLFARLNIQTPVGQDGRLLDARAAMKARKKALDERARFTAAELDVNKLLDDTLRKYGPDDERVQQLAAAVAHINANGYKLVFGPEFLMFGDLKETGFLGDFTRAHLNRATLGSVFERSDSAELAHEVMRIERDQVFGALADLQARVNADPELAAKNPLIAGLRLDTSDSSDLDMVFDDLYDLLRAEQARAAGVLDTAKTKALPYRPLTYLATSNTPLSVGDLDRYDVLLEGLKDKYGEDGVRAIYQALKRSKGRGFRTQGLYNIEAKLRSQPTLIQATRLLGGTQVGVRSSLVGAGAGGLVGAATTQTGESGEVTPWDIARNAAIGAVAGAAGRNLTAAGSKRLTEAWEHSKWLKYAYLADATARLRDTLRFTLSPFFDIQRYTEGAMFAAMADLPKGVSLPSNLSPSKLRRTMRAQYVRDGMSAADAELQVARDWDQITNRFRSAMRGEAVWDASESATKYFTTIGITGYNPLEWQRSTFAHLIRQGVPDDKAYEVVRNIYTYGTKGRSAAEMSVNFVFFPFSFTKKTVTNVARFMGDDISRAVVLHDSLKLYEMANERYGLSEWWDEHMPALDQLYKLNAFGYGISLGELGGVNAPLVKVALDPIVNAFIPQGVELRSMEDASNIEYLGRRLLPVINDMDVFAQNLMDQKEVADGVFDGTWNRRRTEAALGYQEWGEYRQSVEQQLRQAGYRWSDLRRPEFASVAAQVDAKRAELAQKYPGWRESRERTIVNRARSSAEFEDRIARAQTGQGSPVDMALLAFHQQMTYVEDSLSSAGMSTDAEDLPPAVVESLRDVAIGLDQQLGGKFQPLWRKFYERDFGPITRDIRL